MRFIVSVDSKSKFANSRAVTEAIRGTVNKIEGVTKVTARPISLKEEAALKNK